MPVCSAEISGGDAPSAPHLAWKRVGGYPASVTSKRAWLGQALLAFLFVVGAWEDILPGLEAWPSRRIEGPLPQSDADEDAGDGFVLSEVAPEAVLHCEIPMAPERDPQFFTLETDDSAIREPLILCHISHVPIPALYF